jgi:acid stress chaperone HdeA
MSPSLSAGTDCYRLLKERDVNTSKAVVCLIGVILSASCLADSNKEMKPGKMTCQDFIVMDDAYKPQMVYWMDGYNNKGKLQPEDVVLVGQDETVAALVEECKMTPKKSFAQKVKSFFANRKTPISKTYAHE